MLNENLTAIIVIGDKSVTKGYKQHKKSLAHSARLLM
jgi:hypothetical protein